MARMLARSLESFKFHPLQPSIARSGYDAVMARKSELAEETWAAFRGAMEHFQASFLEAARALDLNPGELKTLGALADGPQPMGAIARLLRCDASNVTWLADRLEERGFVERRPDPDDRRVKTLSLTPAGRTAQRQAHQRMHTPPSTLLCLSTSELRTLRDLLTRCAEQPEVGRG
jgi:DNA-binding MarR family transcriptional regulator